MTIIVCWSRAALAVAAALVVVASLVGCGSHELRGKVIEGTYSAVELVPRDDPRLGEPGVGGVSLHLQSDPNRLNRETVARGQSRPDGTFELPVDLPGAGLLEYQVGLFARRPGFAPAQMAFELPSARRWVLITLSRGEDYDMGEERPDPLRDFEEFR